MDMDKKNLGTAAFYNKLLNSLHL